MCICTLIYGQLIFGKRAITVQRGKRDLLNSSEYGHTKGEVSLQPHHVQN